MSAQLKKTFCVAPWVHSSITVTGKIIPCCVSAMPRNYTYEQQIDWWNSTEMASLREDLHNGVQHEWCSHCWKDESLGKKSLRHNYNKMLSPYVNFDQLKDNIKNKNFRIFPMASTWEIDIGNLCNLKCIMCNPILSNKIQDEVLKNSDQYQQFPLIVAQANNYHQTLNWFETEAGKQFIEKIQPTLRWIKIQGGEALAVKAVRDLLERIDGNQITLAIVTNGTILDQRLIQAFKKFKQVNVSLSLEAIGPANDVIRYGSNWETILKSINTFRELEQVNLQFNHVVQATSALFLPDIISFAESMNLPLELILLTDPPHLSLKACPTNAINNLVAQVNNLDISHLKNKFIKSYINQLASTTVFDNDLHEQLQQYVKTLDNIRSKKLAPLIGEIL